MHTIKTTSYTDQPFLVTLETFLVKPLHSNYYSSPRLGSCQQLLVNPTLENRSKTTLPQHTVGTEISCGGFEFREAEALYVRGPQNIILASRS